LKVPELREALEVARINYRWWIRKDLPPSIVDLNISSPRSVDESCLEEVRIRPLHTIVEARLTTRIQLGEVVLRKLEFGRTVIT
jgi:hypothetical protein